MNPQPLPEVECTSSAVQKSATFGTASTPSVQEDQGFEQDAELRAYRFAESIYWKSPAETKFYFFHLRENGVFLVDTRENPNPSVWVCAHLKVLAHVRDNRSEKWGKLVFFKDNDGIAHEIIIANSLLIGEGDEVGRMLVSSGLKMPPGRKALNLLLRFLTECNPKQRARCVERIGWHGEHFVLPGESFGASGEKVYFQADSAYDFNFNIAGSLDEWRTQVGTLCQGNTRLIMAVSAAFAPPLLDVIGEEAVDFISQDRRHLEKQRHFGSLEVFGEAAPIPIFSVGVPPRMVLRRLRKHIAMLSFASTSWPKLIPAKRGKMLTCWPTVAEKGARSKQAVLNVAHDGI